jgi:hypothetical protein
METTMNKSNTERLLKETQKLNEEIKQANVAAGASYGEGTRYYIPPHQRAEFGDGAREITGATDLPTVEHEYRGFKLIPMNKEPWHWTVEAIGFDTPKELECTFTGVQSAEHYINEWHKKEDRKGDKN